MSLKLVYFYFITTSTLPYDPRKQGQVSSLHVQHLPLIKWTNEETSFTCQVFDFLVKESEILRVSFIGQGHTADQVLIQPVWHQSSRFFGYTWSPSSCVAISPPTGSSWALAMLRPLLATPALCCAFPLTWSCSGLPLYKSLGKIIHFPCFYFLTFHSHPSYYWTILQMLPGASQLP